MHQRVHNVHGIGNRVAAWLTKSLGWFMDNPSRLRVGDTAHDERGVGYSPTPPGGRWFS